MRVIRIACASLMTLSLACHPERQAQREATLKVLGSLMEGLEQGQAPEPLPVDLKPYGREAAILVFAHPRISKAIRLNREVSPLIRASMAWMSPRSWAEKATVNQFRTQADQLLGLLDEHNVVLEETFGRKGQRDIDSMDLPAESREAFRKGLQEAYDRTSLTRGFLEAYRERIQKQRDLLAFLEGHLDRMDDTRALFPTPEEGATYRRMVSEERAAMMRVQEKVSAVASQIRSMRAEQRRLIESMKEQ